MDEEKKEENLLNVEGIEEWMTQFVIDPFLDGNIDGIRMDLFETDSSYIIEANVPGFEKHEIKIKVVRDGIHIYFNKNGTKTSRFINIPFSLCKKRITASFEHEILEIMIYKNKKRLTKSPSRYIKIKQGRNL